MSYTPLTSFVHNFVHNASHLLRDSVISDMLSTMIDEGNILDVGCGSGYVARQMVEKMKSRRSVLAQIEGVDVLVPEKTFINIKKYDGVRLPFDDGSFDCVMCIDTLHHAEKPKRLFAELVRVSNKHIIVKDHFYNNWFDLQMLRIVDWMGNRPLGVNLPFNYLKIKGWERLYAAFGLSVEDWKWFRLGFFDPVKHFIVKLKKSSKNTVRIEL